MRPQRALLDMALENQFEFSWSRRELIPQVPLYCFPSPVIRSKLKGILAEQRCYHPFHLCHRQWFANTENLPWEIVF